jgi:hypothetical protein
VQNGESAGNCMGKRCLVSTTSQSVSPDLLATCSSAIKFFDRSSKDCLQNSISSQANAAFAGTASTRPSNYIDDISDSALDQLAQVKLLKRFSSTLFIADLEELYTNPLVWRILIPLYSLAVIHSDSVPGSADLWFIK